MARIVTNVSTKDVEFHALQIPDAQVDDLPEIKRFKNDIVLAESRLAAATTMARDAKNQRTAIADAARKAEHEIDDIELGLPDLAVSALLGNASAKERFAEARKRAEELRSLLRWHKLASISKDINDEASASASLVRQMSDAVLRLEENLAGERRRAKQRIAQQKFFPQGR